MAKLYTQHQKIEMILFYFGLYLEQIQIKIQNNHIVKDQNINIQNDNNQNYNNNSDTSDISDEEDSYVPVYDVFRCNENQEDIP